MSKKSKKGSNIRINYLWSLVWSQINDQIKTCSSRKSESCTWYWYKHLILHAFTIFIKSPELSQINFSFFFVHNQSYPRDSLHHIKITPLPLEHVEHRQNLPIVRNQSLTNHFTSKYELLNFFKSCAHYLMVFGRQSL